MLISQSFDLIATTQGPPYPPAEVIDKNGDFVLVGNISREDGVPWGMAIIDKDSLLPKYGELSPYIIKEDLMNADSERLSEIELFTLPLPLPLNNYPMVFAPEQYPDANKLTRPSYPLNQGYLYDFQVNSGRRVLEKITLGNWLKARATLNVIIPKDRLSARFELNIEQLVPNSLYTVMSLREKDLSPEFPTRPIPLGIPNVFVTDEQGNAQYYAILNNPFPKHSKNSNRIINVIVLFMSSQQSYGGAIGLFGLGGDVHAQLKLKHTNLFDQFNTL